MSPHPITSQLPEKPMVNSSGHKIMEFFRFQRVVGQTDADWRYVGGYPAPDYDADLPHFFGILAGVPSEGLPYPVGA